MCLCCVTLWLSVWLYFLSVQITTVRIVQSWWMTFKLRNPILTYDILFAQFNIWLFVGMKHGTELTAQKQIIWLTGQCGIACSSLTSKFCKCIFLFSYLCLSSFSTNVSMLFTSPTPVVVNFTFMSRFGYRNFFTNKKKTGDDGCWLIGRWLDKSQR